MATIDFDSGFPIFPRIAGGMFPEANNGQVVDAAGESVAYIGQVYLTSGPGTSKVISSTLGKITWTSTTVVYANSATSVRVGIQDVTSDGLEDGVWDVNGDSIGGDGQITTSSVLNFTMDTGSKVIDHGSVYAVVVEMLTKAGTDSIRPSRTTAGTGGFVPYTTADSGGGPAESTQGPQVLLQMDDGSLAHMGESFLPYVVNTQNFNSGSTPDEYAFIFQFPFSGTTNKLFARLADTDAADIGEIRLWNDPFGAPSLIALVNASSTITGADAGAAGAAIYPIGETSISSNTYYAASYCATNTNNRLIGRLNVHPSTMSIGWLPSVWSGGVRTNSSGAFTRDYANIPVVGCFINTINLPDASSVAGGGTTVIYNVIGE